MATVSTTRLELSIGGMTCASCAARVEKTLNALDGVQATVNFATERVSVVFDAGRATAAELVAAVESAGYQAVLPAAAHDDPADAWRLRLLVSAALGAPVVLLSMVSALRFGSWEWAALALATPVVLWGGWPFHRAAFVHLRHGAATMDTLISLGTLAAWGWSVVALLGVGGDLYLEVATGVTVLILLGR